MAALEERLGAVEGGAVLRSPSRVIMESWKEGKGVVEDDEGFEERVQERVKERLERRRREQEEEERVRKREERVIREVEKRIKQEEKGSSIKKTVNNLKQDQKQENVSLHRPNNITLEAPDVQPMQRYNSFALNGLIFFYSTNIYIHFLYFLHGKYFGFWGSFGALLI